ncbi:MAG: TonB-dependent receptor [Woeseiaceae bacterium]|nr:TonB-dependent receptor [Woeseiaceae bacterium]
MSKQSRSLFSMLVSGGLVFVAAAFLQPSSAFAQGATADADSGDTLDEIIVTSRKREENLMEIPVSVSVVDADFIESSNLLSVADIAAVTPGFKVNNAFGRQGDRPVMRGVSGIDTSIELAGYFVDGVYVSGTLSSFDLDSMERVEVIRGPQSATFGRRTFAGAVNYVTQQPTEETKFSVRAELGSNSRQVLAATMSGKAGIWGYRVNARSYSYDGDFSNTLANGPDNIGSEETLSGNATLYITPSDETTIQINALYADDDDGQYGIVLQPSSDNNCTFPNPPPSTTSREYYCGVVRDDVPVSLGGVLRDDQYGVQQERFRSFVKVDHDFGDVGLRWISSYNTNNYYAGQDQTFGGIQSEFSFGAFQALPSVPGGFHSFSASETEDFSHEIWLRGDAADSKLIWSVGAYYFDQEVIDTEDDNPNGFENKVTNTAIMGVLDYEFSDKFTAGLELRYAEDDVSQKPDGSTTVFDETFDSLTHRLTASWFIDDQTMAYFNWSTGTLPGRFNTNSDLPPNLIPVDEGELEQFEVGLKKTVNDQFDFILALYTQEWTDQIRSQFIIINGTPTNYQANQGTTDFTGLEASANWSPINNLMLSAALSFNDSEVNDFISDDATDIAITGDGDVSGAQLPLSPDREGYFGVTLDSPFNNGLNLRSRVDVSYQSSRYARLTNQAETGSETVVNATFTLSNDENWRVSLWGRNLTDEQTPVSLLRYVEADSFFFSGRAFALTPRPGPEYGVTFTYDIQ